MKKQIISLEIKKFDISIKSCIKVNVQIIKCYNFVCSYYFLILYFVSLYIYFFFSQSLGMSIFSASSNHNFLTFNLVNQQINCIEPIIIQNNSGISHSDKNREHSLSLMLISTSSQIQLYQLSSGIKYGQCQHQIRIASGIKGGNSVQKSVDTCKQKQKQQQQQQQQHKVKEKENENEMQKKKDKLSAIQMHFIEYKQLKNHLNSSQYINDLKREQYNWKQHNNNCDREQIQTQLIHKITQPHHSFSAQENIESSLSLDQNHLHPNQKDSFSLKGFLIVHYKLIGISIYKIVQTNDRKYVRNQNRKWESQNKLSDYKYQILFTKFIAIKFGAAFLKLQFGSSNSVYQQIVDREVSGDQQIVDREVSGDQISKQETIGINKKSQTSNQQESCIGIINGSNQCKQFVSIANCVQVSASQIIASQSSILKQNIRKITNYTNNNNNTRQDNNQENPKSKYLKKSNDNKMEQLFILTNENQMFEIKRININQLLLCSSISINKNNTSSNSISTTPQQYAIQSYQIDQDTTKLQSSIVTCLKYYQINSHNSLIQNKQQNIIMCVQGGMVYLLSLPIVSNNNKNRQWYIEGCKKINIRQFLTNSTINNKGDRESKANNSNQEQDFSVLCIQFLPSALALFMVRNTGILLVNLKDFTIVEQLSISCNNKINHQLNYSHQSKYTQYHNYKNYYLPNIKNMRIISSQILSTEQSTTNKNTSQNKSNYDKEQQLLSMDTSQSATINADTKQQLVLQTLIISSTLLMTTKNKITKLALKIKVSKQIIIQTQQNKQHNPDQQTKQTPNQLKQFKELKQQKEFKVIRKLKQVKEKIQVIGFKILQDIQSLNTQAILDIKLLSSQPKNMEQTKDMSKQHNNGQDQEQEKGKHKLTQLFGHYKQGKIFYCVP